MNEEKLKLVLELYKNEHITVQQAQLLLEGAEKTPVINIPAEPYNPWINPLGDPPVITFKNAQ